MRKDSDKKWAVAGVSKRGGKYHFRSTNRKLPTYPNLLKAEGDTNIMMIPMKPPRSRQKCREHLMTLKEFQKPEIIKALQPIKVAAVLVKRTAKRSRKDKKRAA